MTSPAPAVVAALLVLTALAACVPVALPGQEGPVVEATALLDQRSARCAAYSQECAEPTAPARTWLFELRQPAAILVRLAGSPRQLLWLEVSGPGGEILFRGRADALPAVITATGLGVHRLLLSALTRDHEFTVNLAITAR